MNVVRVVTMPNCEEQAHTVSERLELLEAGGSAERLSFSDVRVALGRSKPAARRMISLLLHVTQILFGCYKLSSCKRVSLIDFVPFQSRQNHPPDENGEMDFGHMTKWWSMVIQRMLFSV